MLTEEFHTKSVSPKREWIKESLRAQIRKVGPNGKLPKVVELCGLLGVAKVTLNSALDDLHAEGLILRKRGSGIYVSPRINQKNIALVFGSNIFAAGMSPIYSQLLQRCEQRAKSALENFSFFLDLPSVQADATEHPVHWDLVQAIQFGKLHGLLLISRGSAEEEQWLRSQTVPIVSLDTHQSWAETVVLDYESLVRSGVGELARQGCRRIALILPHPMPDENSQTGWNANARAFKKALERHRLPYQPEWIWQWTLPPADARKTGEEWGRQAFLDLFSADLLEAPDGVVIADDMITRGAMLAARQLGIVVGRDVKVASHANKGSLILQEYAEELALIEFDPAEIVEAMFRMLERLMAGIGSVKKAKLIQPKIKQKQEL